MTPTPAPVQHVVFVGAMGSGKTTIGRRVAAALGVPFVDNDEILERAVGSSAADLAARDGADALHRAEAAVVLDALRARDATVIASAASTITDARVREALRTNAWVVWLRARPETLVARMPGSGTRPFAGVDAVGLVHEQARTRDALFADAADAMFETDAGTADEVVAQVLASADERRLRMLGEDQRPAR